MEFDVRDNGNGSYTVSSKYDADGTGGKVFLIICSIIAYIATIIGLLTSTFVVKDIPYALIILIFLDVLVISPIIIYPIVRKNGKSFSSVLLSILRFVGRYAYIPFSIMYIVLWIFFFNKITGTAFITLFFFSMYGIYYFPYYMLRTARKHNSRMMSILTLVAIYSSITAMVIVAAYNQMDGYYAMVLPTTLALFALISVPISNVYYKKHNSRKGALKLRTIFIIFGISLFVLAFALAVRISLS
ncbi:MAG: hypothetical protein J1F31_00250 [Erysipelotrichales bacterium]|nr:hypothetical protein [Erysipelotrichales bacterium]